ncbi:cyclic nucleotide-binding/CBS domain-containing protein [Saccharothrix longispora]|uniref:CBS domain-containing protein n=1 Tax=Saccharothrix longispora TaxID=33920 RepID=A0ABU1PPM5_9PSEU|nr:CBS domain-containing protein [Saccharothrix longispora]MDR6592622.1 CBS domain-containing protein [Saccharothrix longispora]
MNTADVMTRPVHTVEPTATVRAACALLVDHGFSALPVVGPGGVLVGIVSGSDLLVANLERGAATVAQVMTDSVISAPLTATLSELASAMLGHRLHCLPVVDARGRVVGVVGRGDLLRVLTPDDDVLAGRVNRLLTAYSRTSRWSAEVAGGNVVVAGPFADEAERRVVTALVRTIPGVTGVELRPVVTTDRTD